MLLVASGAKAGLEPLYKCSLKTVCPADRVIYTTADIVCSKKLAQHLGSGVSASYQEIQNQVPAVAFFGGKMQKHRWSLMSSKPTTNAKCKQSLHCPQEVFRDVFAFARSILSGRVWCQLPLLARLRPA